MSIVKEKGVDMPNIYADGDDSWFDFYSIGARLGAKS
jgi:hypothetical protein